MEIIAHRGWWKTAGEKNSRVAFERAFAGGFGIETDLRDAGGQIVISHDMPRGGEMALSELLHLLGSRKLTLALNIKADGMAGEIKRLLAEYRCENYFTFDMSIPEMLCQRDAGLRFFTGLSDIAPNPVMIENASGVWLDSFNSDWFDSQTVDEILRRGKSVCIVSPELHGRGYKSVWQKYKDLHGVALCTDHPSEAQEFFNGKD